MVSKKLLLVVLVTFLLTVFNQSLLYAEQAENQPDSVQTEVSENSDLEQQINEEPADSEQTDQEQIDQEQITDPYVMQETKPNYNQIQIPDIDSLSPEEYALWKSSLFDSENSYTASMSPGSQYAATFVDNNWLRNEFIELYVNSSGRFTMGTTGGNPGSATDNGKRLLYGHPGSRTSITTIRINGRNNIFESNFQNPITNAAGDTNVSIQKINNIKITQTLAFQMNPYTGQQDIIKIKYDVKNEGNTAATVGTRIMLDTQLGENDGAPFKIDDVGDCTTEMEFLGDNIPRTWQCFDSLSEPTVISTGIFYLDESERPDKVQFADWTKVSDIYWNCIMEDGRRITGDSAVTMEFNEKPLAPRETRSYVTYYGLSAFAAQDLRPPLAIGVFAPRELGVRRGQYLPNPFTVTAHIENVGTGDAINSKAVIELPQGISLAGESTAEVDLGTISKNQVKQVTWQVQVPDQAEATSFNYSIVATADNTDTKSINLSVDVPVMTYTDEYDGVSIAQGTKTPGSIQITFNDDDFKQYQYLVAKINNETGEPEDPKMLRKFKKFSKQTVDNIKATADMAVFVRSADKNNEEIIGFVKVKVSDIKALKAPSAKVKSLQAGEEGYTTLTFSKSYMGLEYQVALSADELLEANWLSCPVNESSLTKPVSARAQAQANYQAYIRTAEVFEYSPASLPTKGVKTLVSPGAPQIAAYVSEGSKPGTKKLTLSPLADAQIDYTKLQYAVAAPDLTPEELQGNKVKWAKIKNIETDSIKVKTPDNYAIYVRYAKTRIDPPSVAVKAFNQ